MPSGAGEAAHTTSQHPQKQHHRHGLQAQPGWRTLRRIPRKTAAAGPRPGLAQATASGYPSAAADRLAGAGEGGREGLEVVPNAWW